MGNSLNLQEIDQEQALNLTKFFIRAEKNLFLFGRRGTGKTEIALQAAKECGLKVNYINLSVIERPDLAGYPDINAKGDVISFKSPAFLPTLMDKSEPDSIILFDEVDKATPEITAPLLEILQFKSINGKKINAVSCLLTGNLANERAYSNQISSALLDRGSKYILSFNFEKWMEWAKVNQVHDLILGFLKSNVNLACGEMEETNYASPSPRGWVLASDCLFKAKDHKIVDVETITQIISGYVGAEAGLKFKMWYEYYRKFEPFIHSLIDAGSMTFDFQSLMPTEKIIFVISACYHAKQQTLSINVKSKNRFLYLENLCKFLISYHIDREIQIMGLNNAFSFELITKHKLYSCTQFFNLFKEITENVSLK